MSPLVILLPRKGYLQHFGSKIAKIVRCYCHNLGQSEKNIFDFSLCVRWAQGRAAGTYEDVRTGTYFVRLVNPITIRGRGRLHPIYMLVLTIFLTFRRALKAGSIKPHCCPKLRCPKLDCSSDFCDWPEKKALLLLWLPFHCN